MATDPGGGQPFAFGSRFAPLAADQTGNQGKGKNSKRSANRDMNHEMQYRKQGRIENLNGPRFLILQRTNGTRSMEDVSPFLIKKTMDSITSNVEISRSKDGTLLLKTVNRAQADKLLRQTKFGEDIQIRIIEHPTLNTIKGTIYCEDLKKLSEDVIQKELAEFHVTEVKRIKRKGKDGKLYDTAIHILTFNMCNLPDSIEAGFHKCKVKLYIPSPLRCMNCLRFGHKKDKCTGNGVCANCAEQLHINRPCTTKVTCASCGGDHHTLDRTCPVYLDELEIQRIRTVEKLPIRDARRKRREQVPAVPVFTKSYAQVASTRPANNRFQQKQNQETTPILPDNPGPSRTQNNLTARPLPEESTTSSQAEVYTPANTNIQPISPTPLPRGIPSPNFHSISPSPSLLSLTDLDNNNDLPTDSAPFNTNTTNKDPLMDLSDESLIENHPNNYTNTTEFTNDQQDPQQSETNNLQVLSQAVRESLEI